MFWDFGFSATEASQRPTQHFRLCGVTVCLRLRRRQQILQYLRRLVLVSYPSRGYAPSSCFKVTHRGVVTYSCDAVSTGSGDFVGNAILSVTRQVDGSFSSASTCSETTLSFFAVVKEAITASSLAGTVITCKTVSRSGTARRSSANTALASFQESQSCCKRNCHSFRSTDRECYALGSWSHDRQVLSLFGAT